MPYNNNRSHAKFTEKESCEELWPSTSSEVWYKISIKTYEDDMYINAGHCQCSENVMGLKGQKLITERHVRFIVVYIYGNSDGNDYR